MLAALSDANVFLTRLDERGEWFRYHRLFADLVMSTVPSGTEDRAPPPRHGMVRCHTIYRRTRSAMRSLQETPRWQRSQIETAFESRLAHGELRTILGWCDALPPDVLASQPGFASAAPGSCSSWAISAGAEAAIADHR